MIRNDAEYREAMEMEEIIRNNPEVYRNNELRDIMEDIIDWENAHDWALKEAYVKY
jgi:hypothetical protein